MINHLTIHIPSLGLVLCRCWTTVGSTEIGCQLIVTSEIPKKNPVGFSQIGCVFFLSKNMLFFQKQKFPRKVALSYFFVPILGWKFSMKFSLNLFWKLLNIYLFPTLPGPTHRQDFGKRKKNSKNNSGKILAENIKEEFATSFISNPGKWRCLPNAESHQVIIFNTCE